jgi:hypothetical protein
LPVSSSIRISLHPLKFRSKDEFIQFLILTENNFFVAAFPFFMAFVHVKDIITDLHHTIHVVRIYNGGSIVLQVISGSPVYHQSSVWGQDRNWAHHKKIFWI